MKTLLKKILFTLLTITVLSASTLSLFASPAHAQSTWYNLEFKEFYHKVYDTNVSPEDEIFGERYTAAQVQWIIWSVPSLVINAILGPELGACLMDWQPTAPTSIFNLIWGAATFPCYNEIIDKLTLNGTSAGPFYAQQKTNDGTSLAQKGSFLKSYLSANPISGIGYVLNKFEKFNIRLVPEAQAQAPGFGFSALQNTVQKMWKVSRDISYFLLVLAIIAVAFMIMFRTKISPQVVITVQSAIPRIVIVLVLITFSYAIAGFMIDLMYVVIGLVAALFTQSGVIIAGTIPTPSVWGDTFKALTEGVGGMGIIGWLGNWFAVFEIVFIITMINIIASGNIAAIITGLLGFILFPLIILVVDVIVLFLIVRILWMMFLTYAKIILSIIVAPFYILAGAVFPGFGFGSWLKSLAANLAVYPVVGVLLIMSFVFLGAAGGQFAVWAFNALPYGLNFEPTLFSGGTTWSPPLTVGTEDFFPLLFLAVSLVILSLIPKVADIIKGLITGRPYTYGAAIGEAIAPVGLMYGQTVGPSVGAARKLGAEYTGRRILTGLSGELAKHEKTTWVAKHLKDAAGREED